MYMRTTKIDSSYQNLTTPKDLTQDLAINWLFVQQDRDDEVLHILR